MLARLQRRRLRQQVALTVAVYRRAKRIGCIYNTTTNVSAVTVQELKELSFSAAWTLCLKR